MLKNKSAQIGETMTWLVATIVIVVILILSVYAALILAKVKHIGIRELEVEEDEGFYAGVGFIKVNNAGKILDTKTSIAQTINENNKAIINDWLEEENENE